MHVTQRDGSVQATQAQVVQFARNMTCAHAVLTLRDVAPMTPVLSGPSAWPASSATIFSPNCATRAGLHSRAIRSRRRWPCSIVTEGQASHNRSHQSALGRQEHHLRGTPTGR